MLLRVGSLARSEMLAKDWADRVVSLVDLCTELPIFAQANHLIIRMSDTEVFTDPLSPRLEDVKEVFDFCLPHQNILVHCIGGISRSTAMSIGLLVRDGISMVDAVKQVHDQSPRLFPNKLILQHIDQLLNMKGKFVADVQAAIAAIPPQPMMLWCDKCKEHFEDGNNCQGKHFQ